MFPPRRKRHALVKKEMRVCRLVTGDDPDATELLQAALESGVRRVVVKRPAGAPPLSASPSHSTTGRSTRFDVYLPPRG